VFVGVDGVDVKKVDGWMECFVDGWIAEWLMECIEAKSGSNSANKGLLCIVQI
jgi:hypothetical protein